MNENVGFRAKPEEEELQLKRRELEELEKQLIERELQLVSLRGELADFENVYIKNVGIRYAELDDVEAQIAEFLAACSPDDIAAQTEAQAARSRADESQTSTTELTVKDTKRFSSSPSLKTLYREVARRIHPDLAVDDADRQKRQRLMAEVNQAYENGDEARPRGILEEYEGSPEAVFGEGTAVELVRVIRKIAQVKRRLKEIEAERQNVMVSDLFELKKKTDEGTKEGRDVLNEMASAVRSRIAERRADFENIRARGKK